MNALTTDANLTKLREQLTSKLAHSIDSKTSNGLSIVCRREEKLNEVLCHNNHNKETETEAR